MKMVKLTLMQVRGNKTPISYMREASLEHGTTPTKPGLQEKITTPSSRSPMGEKTSRKSSGGSRQKLKDVDGDDKDIEYTPRRGSKRPKLDGEPSFPRLRSTRRAPCPFHVVDESSIISNAERRSALLPPRFERRALSSAGFTVNNESTAPLADRRPMSPTLHHEDRHLEDGEVEVARTLAKDLGEDLRQTSDKGNLNQADERPSLADLAEDAFVPPVDTSFAPATQEVPNTLSELPTQNTQSSPAPEIRYYIISRVPRLIQRHWPEGSLGAKSVNGIFKDVEFFTSRRGIRKISFKLTTSRKEAIFTVSRQGPSNIYETMKKKFAADINADLARGETEFDIELEPDPREDVEEMEEGGDVVPRFSF